MTITPERYRSVTEIEAVQLPGEPFADMAPTAYVERCIAIAEWCGGTSHMMTAPGERAHRGAIILGPHMVVPTPTGDVSGRPGNWIIKDDLGFHWCSPDRFAATFESLVDYCMTPGSDTTLPAEPPSMTNPRHLRFAADVAQQIVGTATLFDVPPARMRAIAAALEAGRMSPNELPLTPSEGSGE